MSNQISGSLSSKQVSKVFSTQVKVSTTSNHLVHVPTLLDTRANSCFIERDFARLHQVTLRKLPCPTFVLVIDGRPITSENIVEKSELVRVELDKLVRVISFNIISSPKHLIVLGLPLFELRNPEINYLFGLLA